MIDLTDALRLVTRNESPLNNGEKLLLLYMMGFMNETNSRVIIGSAKVMAERTGLSSRSVQRLVSCLKKRGLLEVVNHQDDKGLKTANSYRLVL